MASGCEAREGVSARIKRAARPGLQPWPRVHGGLLPAPAAGGQAGWSCLGPSEQPWGAGFASQHPDGGWRSVGASRLSPGLPRLLTILPATLPSAPAHRSRGRWRAEASCQKWPPGDRSHQEDPAGITLLHTAWAPPRQPHGRPECLAGQAPFRTGQLGASQGARAAFRSGDSTPRRPPPPLPPEAPGPAPRWSA